MPTAHLPSAEDRRVLVAAADRLDSHLAALYVPSHLTEMPVVDAASPGEQITAAVVFDDFAVAEQLASSCTPTVYVLTKMPKGTAESPWPDGAIRCLHHPGWLNGSDHFGIRTLGTMPYSEEGVHSIGAIAPPRLARGRGSDSTLLQMAAPRPDGGEGAIGAMLAEVVQRLTSAGVALDAVAMHGPAESTKALCDELSTCFHQTTFVPSPAEADFHQLLSGSGLLISEPSLLAVTQAHSVRIPLVFLDPADDDQAELMDTLRATKIGFTTLSEQGGDPSGTVRAVAPTLWDEISERLDSADDDRRGAQRVARQVRQLFILS